MKAETRSLLAASLDRHAKETEVGGVAKTRGDGSSKTGNGAMQSGQREWDVDVKVGSKAIGTSPPFTTRVAGTECLDNFIFRV